MSPVLVSIRSQIALRCLKTLVLAAVLTVPLLTLTAMTNDAQTAAQKPTVKPVLAASEQDVDLRLPPVIPGNLVNLPADASRTQQNKTPDDTFAQQQWSLHNNPSIAGATGLFGAQDYITGVSDVVVAVVDSGVMLQHEDLTFLPGYDFIHEPTVGNDGDGRDHDPTDPGDWVNQQDIEQQIVSAGCPIAASKWHGTAISGIIAAIPYNATGIAGGSPSVSLLPVRVTGKCGGYVTDLIDGIRWAAGLEVNGVATNQHPADVINLSVGFQGSCSNALQSAINDAVNAGAILVTAATNSTANLDSEPYSPAACENVLTVAATDRDGSITSYTALGQSVFISAPGGTVTDGIITTQNDGIDNSEPRSSYGYHYGTSIAAAHVSSAIANLLAYRSDLSFTQIKQLLSVSATSIDFDPNCRSGQCGQGLLNAYAAMELLASDYLLDDGTTDSGDNIPVQLAATSSTASARDSVVTTAANDDVWAGALDWYQFLAIVLLLSLRARITRHL